MPHNPLSLGLLLVLAGLGLRGFAAEDFGDVEHNPIMIERLDAEHFEPYDPDVEMASSDTDSDTEQMSGGKRKSKSQSTANPNKK